MKDFDLIIIGAGPAGLFAAALCGAAGLKTCVIESNRAAGKKLLITGQGKCNITNTADIKDLINGYGKKTRFVRKCLYAFSNTDLLNYFSDAGLRLEARPDGKVFPVSESAAEVRDHLLRQCVNAGVEFSYGCRAERISRTGGVFRVFTAEQSRTVSAPLLMIAAGGFTFPDTGSNGSGYRLAEMLGHSIISPRPSLTGVISDTTDFSGFIACAGIALDCELDLYRNNSKTGSYEGRLLFTHRGLSGPVVIDNSRDFMPDDELKINLVPGNSYESLSADFIGYCAAGGRAGIKHFFTGKTIPERLVSAVFDSSGAAAAPSDRAADISAADRKKLISAFTALSFRIKSLEGRNRAMCTAGGVDTTEINPESMESKLLPGLYFSGEVMDVDGDSGGYNLQFAFSSARAAAMSILKQKQIDVDA